MAESATPFSEHVMAKPKTEAPHQTSHVQTKPNKKKKKKSTFKNMMDSILTSSTGEEERINAQRDSLMTHLGGGQFSKLDKI